MKTYNAAIIGLGFIGAGDQISGDALGQNVENLDGTHYETYTNHKRIKLIAGSSRDSGRRKRFFEKAKVRTYSDWRELINNEKIDIVSIATYTPSHEEITVACSERGIKVIFCEKPIAPSLNAAIYMLNICSKNNTLLVFNHQRRFNTNYIKLKNLIVKNKLGDITSINAQWPSGRLGNVGTHIIDAIFMLTGRNAIAVSGTLDNTGKIDCRGPQFNDPGVWGIIKLKDNIMVTIDAGDYNHTPFEIKINCNKGRAITGDKVVQIEFWNNKNKITYNEFPNISNMNNALIKIISWLDNKSQFEYLPHEAFDVLETIIAFYESNSNNSKWINLPLPSKSYNIVLNSG